MQQRQRPPEVAVSDGLRVLIVEAVAAAAELAVRQLAQGGVTCTYLQVSTEKDFRAALLRFSPDLILSELVLPRLDGLTALEMARRELPDVPFIFLSGTPGEERAVEAMRRGAADYVLKTNASRLVPAVLGALREVGVRARLRTHEQQARDKEQRRHEHQQERIARLTRMLQMQSGINAAVVRIREREDLLREACRLALQVGGYEHAMISLVAADGRRARPWYRLGMAPGYLEKLEFQIGDGTEPDTSLVGRALRTGQISISTDLTQSEPPVAGRVELLERGFHSVVALPLTVDGARIGVLSLASRESDLVSEEELRLLQDMIANLSFALQYRQKENTVQYLAYYDPLTGLAKRGLFCERLDRLLQSRVGPEAVPTVVAFDVMNLSNVNDSFGRHVGDLLLQRVAERLRHQIDDDERIGYLGGGTFVMVPTQSEVSADNVTTLLDNTVFRDVFQIEGRAIRTSFKSGLAHYPMDGEDASTLTQRAEAALKQAKESGEQYLHYQIQMHSDIAERLALEHKLRIALDEKQFVLHYQPQINVATGRIEAVEALLRWHDPTEGLMHPALFLPVLESSGMIVPVGEWALHEAVKDCCRWHRMGLGPVRVAVNVSVQQVRRRTFVDTVLGAAGDCLADGFGVDIEITETGLLHDMEGASRKLRELRNAGMRIAIDDFGTGYSSLGLLSKLPVDILKVDRSFISGLPGDRASVTLVSSIIGLASAFNLTVVAEGVETLGQLEQLRRLKCNYSQGYLHSRPVPSLELERMLAAQSIRVGRTTQAGKVSG
jgi:diguanylate cyclase (GGDEF)-like protein